MTDKAASALASPASPATAVSAALACVPGPTSYTFNLPNESITIIARSKPHRAATAASNTAPAPGIETAYEAPKLSELPAAISIIAII